MGHCDRELMPTGTMKLRASTPENPSPLPERLAAADIPTATTEQGPDLFTALFVFVPHLSVK